MRRTALLLALLLVLAASDQPSASPDLSREQDVFRAGPRVLLRNYALAACLSQGFPAISAEASAAAGGYLELGAASWEAHLEADALARTFLARPYASKHGARLDVMKCIDLSHSQELDALVAKHLPARPGKAAR